MLQKMIILDREILLLLSIMIMINVSSCGHKNSIEKNNKQAMPSQFNEKEIENEIHWDEKKFKDIKIIKWKIEVDERPLYIESAIVIGMYNNKWALIHVFKHPKAKKKAKWHISIIFDALHTRFETYKRLPTKKELEKFEKDTWWTDMPRKGFRLIGFGICNDNYKEYIK